MFDRGGWCSPASAVCRCLKPATGTQVARGQSVLGHVASPHFLHGRVGLGTGQACSSSPASGGRPEPPPPSRQLSGPSGGLRGTLLEPLSTDDPSSRRHGGLPRTSPLPPPRAALPAWVEREPLKLSTLTPPPSRPGSQVQTPTEPRSRVCGAPRCTVRLALKRNAAPGDTRENRPVVGPHVLSAVRAVLLSAIWRGTIHVGGHGVGCSPNSTPGARLSTPPVRASSTDVVRTRLSVRLKHHGVSHRSPGSSEGGPERRAPRLWDGGRLPRGQPRPGPREVGQRLLGWFSLTVAPSGGCIKGPTRLAAWFRKACKVRAALTFLNNFANQRRMLSRRDGPLLPRGAHTRPRRPSALHAGGGRLRDGTFSPWKKVTTNPSGVPVTCHPQRRVGRAPPHGGPGVGRQGEVTSPPAGLQVSTGGGSRPRRMRGRSGERRPAGTEEGRGKVDSPCVST